MTQWAPPRSALKNKQISWKSCGSGEARACYSCWYDHPTGLHRERKHIRKLFKRLQGRALVPWECDLNYVKHLLHKEPGNKVLAIANFCRTLARCFDPSLIQCLLVSITIVVSKDKNLAFCLFINRRQVTWWINGKEFNKDVLCIVGVCSPECMSVRALFFAWRIDFIHCLQSSSVIFASKYFFSLLFIFSIMEVDK